MILSRGQEIIADQVQWSVHPPNSYICTHADQLLPDWSVSVHSILIVLQRCQFSFGDRTPQSEILKDQLREKFFRIGSAIASQAKQQGYRADLFDPRTGLPMLSLPGPTSLDDVAVACSSLGYAAASQRGCRLLIHPQWGKAVYPSILVSSAPPAVLAAIATEILQSPMLNAS